MLAVMPELACFALPIFMTTALSCYQSSFTTYSNPPASCQLQSDTAARELVVSAPAQPVREQQALQTNWTPLFVSCLVHYIPWFRPQNHLDIQDATYPVEAHRADVVSYKSGTSVAQAQVSLTHMEGLTLGSIHYIIAVQLQPLGTGHNQIPQIWPSNLIERRGQ